MDEIRDKVNARGITFLPFAEVTVTIQRGKFASVLGTLDHEGLVCEYFVFVSCFVSSI